jgi:hypothetical protein
MDLTNLPFLAGLGAIGLMWNQIKGVASRTTSLVINRVGLRDFAAGAVATYIWRYCKAVDTGTYKYHANTFITKLFSNSILIGSKRLSNKYQLFFHEGVPILAKYDDWDERAISVCFIRGTIDFDKLFLDAIEDWNYLVLNNANRFRVETLVGKNHNALNLNLKQPANGGETEPIPQSSSSFSGITFDNLHYLAGKPFKYSISDLGKDYNCFLKSYILDESLNDITSEIESWVKLGNWYKEKGLIWRRGYLLHGKAGTGKTTYVRAIGTKFNLPIFRFDLSSMTNRDFLDSWGRIILESPCIALFEDIDTVFNQRENVTKLENGLSFDCFLNVISGAMPAEGVLLFVTTNKIETLDNALGNIGENGIASRPGRIDRIIEIKNLSLKKKEELANLILSEFPESIAEALENAESLTNAQFTEKCSQIALKKMWKV